MSKSALLTVRDMAQILGVHPSTVRRHCASGDIPAELSVGKRGGRSGQVYMIPSSSLRVEGGSPTNASSNSSTISIGTFRAKGGKQAIRYASDRLEIIRIAHAVTGPNRTQKLRTLAKSHGIGLATLYRWMDLSGTGQASQPTLEGAARTLRSKFDERGMRRRISIEPEARDFFHAIWLQHNRPPVPYVIEMHYIPKAREMGWRIPSRATFYRLVAQDLSAVERTLAKEGVAKVRGTMAPKNTLAAPTLTNKLWVADSRPHDIWVKHPETGEPVRPHLVAFLDAASRGLLGDAHTLAPNTEAVKNAFAKAIYPEVPFRMGLPEYVLFDNGSEFQNKIMQDLLPSLGIKQHDAAVGAGWEKGVIESFYKLVSLWFDRSFKSWTGNNPLNRPEGLDEKRMAREGQLYEWDEFLASWAEFKQWYNTQHQHSGDGMNGKTPAERYAELRSARIGVPSLEALELLGMREERRKVGDQGIKLQNTFIYHGDLFDFDNRVKRPLVGEWVTVRFDPKDLSRVYVFYEGVFVCIASEKIKPTWDPEDEENMEIAGRVHAKAKKLIKDGLERLHQRKEAGDLNPWIPDRNRTITTGTPVDPAPRMITPMDSTVRQVKEQEKAERRAAAKSRNDSVSAKIRSNRIS